jgi:predicted ATPase/DNA-binding CsgD family transcriptional regulator
MTEASVQIASCIPASFWQGVMLSAVKESSFNVSTWFSPFLGHEQEVKNVCALMRSSDTRLLTLTGTGGVGKTRLALKVAEELLEAFADGIYFIPLASVIDPTLVLPTIARVFELGEFGERKSLERIKAHIQEKHLLLLLDNFEQVITAAPLLVEVLIACPHMKMLVTSRETLRVRGERECVVLPLPLPDPRRLPDHATLAGYTAVQLFLQHAQAANPDFQMTDENAHAIVELCIHLDGLPLAIELAARHIHLLSPQKLLARMERRLPVLMSGTRDVSERQRSLRNAIKWSYDLLNQQEQRVFRRLSVFVGGCLLEAVEAVCSAIDGTAINIVESVMSLLDKHLLQSRAQGDGEPRLLMLETLREYAQECLETSGEADAARHAHAELYLALAEEAEPELRKAQQVVWLERLEREHNNLRAALNWWTAWENSQKALRLCAALWRFWVLRGHLSEGSQCLERALAGCRSEMTQVRAKALEGAGRIAIHQSNLGRASSVFTELASLFHVLHDKRIAALSLNARGYVQRHKGDYAAAQALFEQSLALYKEAPDRWGIAETLWLISDRAYFQGDCDTALTLGQESLSIYKELDDKANMPTVLSSLATILTFQGKYAEARTVAEESIAISHELGDEHGFNYAYGLSILGRVAFYDGDCAKAHTLLQESLKIFRELDIQRGIAHALGFLGHLTLHRGNPGTARTYLEEGLNRAMRLGDKWIVTLCLDGLGKVLVVQKQMVWAARLWGGSEALRETITAHGRPIERIDYEASLATVRAALGEKAFVRAWDEGRRMSLDEIWTALLSCIPSQIPEEQGESVSRPTVRSCPDKQRSSVLEHIDELTAREREVMELVALGLTDAQVADKLFISTRTVNAHLRSIYNKLDVTSRSAAIYRAT